MSCRHRAAYVRVALAVVAVAVAAVAPYVSSARDYFLADDFGLVQLFAHKPTFHVLSIVTAPWTEAIYGIRPDELRPTLALTYQFDSLWGANNPLGYHVSNIVFHVLCSLLVLTMAWRIAHVRLLAAALAGALFAVLPIHPETVVWISGRADSIPALFYLSATLAYALWRRSGGRWLFAAALVAFVFGLFSKQSAITLPAMLLAHDLLVLRPTRPFRWWLVGWLPFAALALGYLALRYSLFGNAVREQLLTSETLTEFAMRQATYVKLLLVGSARIGAEQVTPELAQLGRLTVWLLIALALVAVLVALGRGARGWWPTLLYFGPVWWLICVAPLVVTYETARHLYLPSAGVAVAMSLILDVVGRGGRLRQAGSILLGAGLLFGSVRLLDRAIEPWHQAAVVSGRMAEDLERELALAPVGSLIVLGAPQFGASLEYHAWMWMWSMPFVAQPPFVSAGSGERVTFVVPPDVYCCPRDQWMAYTTSAIATWSTRPDRPPAIVLRWDGFDGTLDKQTDHDLAGLRAQLEAIGGAPRFDDACRQLIAILPAHVTNCA